MVWANFDGKLVSSTMHGSHYCWRDIIIVNIIIIAIIIICINTFGRKVWNVSV